MLPNAKSVIMFAATIVNTKSDFMEQTPKNKSRMRKAVTSEKSVDIKNGKIGTIDFQPSSPSDKEIIEITEASCKKAEDIHNFSNYNRIKSDSKCTASCRNAFTSSEESSLCYFLPDASEKMFILLTSYFNVDSGSFQACHDIVNSLLYLLPQELQSPRNDFLFKVDPNCCEKLSAELRDEAIFNLRFLHKFYLSSSFVFADAVSIVDRFIVRVKVQPKYIACVATAAYYVALKRNASSEDRPSAEELVTMARCGGSVKDLERMEAIIRSKLGVDFEPVATSHFFLQALSSLLSEENLQNSFTILERALCFAEVYQHRPATLAIALLAQHLPSKPAHKIHTTDCVHPVVYHIADFCNVTWAEVQICLRHLVQMNAAAIDKRPISPKRLTWTLSQRTLSQLQRPAVQAGARKLPSICEDPQSWWEEQEDGLDLGRLFVD